ncbi:MAG: ABC transporter permease [Terracoccus sp.]
MTTLVLVRRFLTDYVRNPVNLLLLALIPTVFVVVVGGSLSDFTKLLGGPPGSSVQTATAGWAAAFLAGIAMYFQTAATRDTDRRVVIAGLPASRLALARLLTGACLALLAATTALIALAARTGIDSPLRAVAGTLMFAVIYVAIGAGVGSVVSSPVNGTVIVLFVWILDVFFGPAMGASDRLATRGLPTHFVTVWMLNLPSGHGGPIGDLGWALLTTIAAAVAAWALVATRSRTAHVKARRTRPGSRFEQAVAAWRAAWQDARRNPTLWVLFVIVPVVFILGADAITPNTPITFFLTGPNGLVPHAFTMLEVHDATMAPIAVGSLAALVGLFTVLDSHGGDRRAALSGLRPASLLTARLGVLLFAALGATAISLATTALVFHAEHWPTYAAANLLIAVTYGLIGALLAPIFGRVGGVFIAFLLPFLDLGIAQSAMLHATPTAGSTLLPGYGGSRVLLDGALLGTFDDWAALWVGLGWVVVLAVAVTVVYWRATRPAHTPAAAAPVPAGRTAGRHELAQR